MGSLFKKTFAIAAALVLSSGCYSTKLMEFTYQELDTVKTTQQELAAQVDELTRLVEIERDERVRAQADLALTLSELRELLEVLSSRFDDTQQLLSSRPPPVPVGVAHVDSGLTVDTTAVALPDSAEVMSGFSGDSDADGLFKGSYMDLTLGNYDLAVQGFKNYLVRYPNGANLPDAHYYLGESYYALERYLEAVAEYQAVIREHPRSRFVPAAYLKSGYCYQHLEENQLAEKSFRELIALYPRSEEAEQARVTLRDLGG